MKNTFLLLLLIVFSFFSCDQTEKKLTIENETENSNFLQIKNNEDLLGDWEFESNSENNDTFSITLFKSEQGGIEGKYCAVARNGSKIDCSPDEHRNIKQIRKIDNGYLVSFSSFFNAQNGEAEITLENGKLHWKILTTPSGEFYAPKDVLLSKKRKNVASNNPISKMNIDEKSYKAQDITMQLYKEIIEYYGCGDASVMGMNLGKMNENEVFIVENNCGDFIFKDLLSLRNGKIMDKLTLESSSFDMEKFEDQNIKDETIQIFHIGTLSEIKITTIHSIDENTKSRKTEIYYLDNFGKFQKR